MKLSLSELVAELEVLKDSPIDGKNRLVSDYAEVLADGETWGVVNDHGNVELCHKGRNGRICSHGGLE